MRTRTRKVGGAIREQMLSRRYYDSRRWKITTYLDPFGREPDCRSHGWRYIKQYDYRDGLSGPYTTVRIVFEANPHSDVAGSKLTRT